MAGTVRNNEENVELRPIIISEEIIKPTCCISRAQGVRIIGVISCALGTFISCLVLFYNDQHRDDISSIDPDPRSHLLTVGLTSVLSSAWLIWKEGSPSASKQWTVVHIICCIIYVVMFAKLLTDTKYDRLMQVLLSIAGVNFCIMVFNVLVMIEFLYFT